MMPGCPGARGAVATDTINFGERHTGMNITLRPDLEQRVREKIARGDYDDSDALVQEAVHRLIEEDEGDMASLRIRLRQADAEIDRGEGLEFDEDTTKELSRAISMNEACVALRSFRSPSRAD